MDEDNYRKTYRELIDTPCPFEKAVLRHCADCHFALVINLAERHAIGCQSEMAQQRCLDFSNALHERAAFAVGLGRLSGPVPHGKEIKIQCGGMLGVQQALGLGGDPAHAGDISALLDAAAVRFGDLDRLPYESIVRAIAGFKNR